MGVSSTHALLAEHVKRTKYLWHRLFAQFGMDPNISIEHIEIDDTNLTTTKPLERFADVVLRIRTSVGEICLIVEAQRHKDDSKRPAWFLYSALAYDRYRCPTSVVVIADSLAVERWAAEPYEVSVGYMYAPVVLGPSTLPTELHHDIVQADIDYALLCATVHHQNPKASLLWHAIFAHIRPMLADPTIEDADLFYYINTLEHAATAAWREEHMEPIMEELLYTERLQKQGRDQVLAKFWSLALDAASLVCTPEELADFESRTPSEASLKALQKLFRAKRAERAQT